MKQSYNQGDSGNDDLSPVDSKSNFYELGRKKLMLPISNAETAPFCKDFDIPVDDQLAVSPL